MRLLPLLLALPLASAAGASPGEARTLERFVATVDLTLARPGGSWLSGGAPGAWELREIYVNPIVTNPRAVHLYERRVRRATRGLLAVEVHEAGGAVTRRHPAALYPASGLEGGLPGTCALGQLGQLGDVLRASEVVVPITPSTQALVVRLGERELYRLTRPAEPPGVEAFGLGVPPGARGPSRPLEVSWSLRAPVPASPTWFQLMSRSALTGWRDHPGARSPAALAAGSYRGPDLRLRHGTVEAELTYTDGFTCVVRRAWVER